VRHAWESYPETVPLSTLARASAACLPSREGLDRVLSALSDQQGSQKRELMSSLSYFHSPESLDWIERNIFEPISEHWGHLAAASQLDWPRVERWLSSGRPLSLVALDALLAIIKPRTPLLRDHGPRLHQAPRPDQFLLALSDCADRDRVPRVRRAVDRLKSEVAKLTEDLRL
jgi:hypothetical protein